MEGLLQQIVERKRAEVAAASRRRPESRLQEIIAALPPGRPFRGALVRPGPAGANVIAEFKRASPSRGPISPEADPARVAAGYATAGAAVLSVLTDRDFFHGSDQDLQRVREVAALPVLRKDFVISEYQLLEARVMGADAVLLIARILSPVQLREYLALSAELGLDALVEVHDEAELALAAEAGAMLVGINSRDLDTFHTDLAVVERLALRLGPGQTAVAESGIRTAADLVRLKEVGIHNFLIGETLMASPDPGAALGRLLSDFARLSGHLEAPALSEIRIR
jgi:indole-3-glycerol phosphate synthase